MTSLMTPLATSLIDPLDGVALDRLRRQYRVEPRRLRRFRTLLFKHGAPDHEALAVLPGEFVERLRLHPLTLFERRDSSIDGATKLLFRTDDGTLIETVILRIATGRTTLCLSSQAGCAAGCAFCATAQMGLARQLTPAEIVDQVVQARQLIASEGRQIRNIVFMGMGEPLHNEASLHGALDRLISAELLHHAPAKTLVSTVGVPEAMIRLARRFARVNLALSLHSVDQEVRASLIPVARKHPVDVLRQALSNVQEIQRAGRDGRPASVMIEYLMLEGLNDRPEDAEALAAWLEGLSVHVNLIPLNPIEGETRLRGSSPAVRERFAGQLKQAGFPTTIRYSLGADVAAACGQLVQQTNRRIAAERSLA